ncbi:MAG: hypothetical protein PHN68_00570 [Prolixibacteraceae bacterium]|nr:hypothetical protein [Prolixibacteraceae bacterium]MDD4754896.1 hypothetical protein [Prolixibacteraceae bacterium]NLO03962.1 hypothetical protein [Bacteroidales bacterium]
MRTVIQILLVIVAIGLAYLIYKSIQDPIDFEKAKAARYDATIQRLKDIRKAQLAYKDVYGRFTGSWDTLIDFVKTDSVRNVRKVGELTDSMIEAGITERKAISLGLLIRDTVRVSVLESVFNPSFNPEQLKYVPVPDTVAEFNLGANVITTGSGIKVPVFEARAHNNIVLRGLDRQYVINLNETNRLNEKYPGLKVGSLTETVNNAGNWE